VGLAASAPAVGILVARGSREGGLARWRRKKGSVLPVSGGQRRRRRPCPAGMGATLVIVIAGVVFVREREIRNPRGFSLRRKGLGLSHPFHVIGYAPFAPPTLVFAPLLCGLNLCLLSTLLLLNFLLSFFFIYLLFFFLLKKEKTKYFKL